MIFVTEDENIGPLKPTSSTKITMTPPVAIIMGSQSDWPTMKKAAESLSLLQIPYEVKIVSAHRTPERLYTFATGAKKAGYKVIIAGTSMAAHLPGMAASMTDLPVIGVPVESRSLKGMDSLLSIAQMPGGIPVATCTIGEAGAKNAGLLAARILALSDPEIAERVERYRIELAESVPETVDEGS